MSDIASFLKARFEMEPKDIAEESGIPVLSVIAIFSGRRTPTTEQLLRLACLAGDHPADFFEAAGKSTLAELVRESYPDWQQR